MPHTLTHPTLNGAAADTVELAEFDDYGGAERLVDRLSDAGFPVEHVRILGTGIQSVEQVTGRMTKARASVAGAASGAWFGLLIGLLLSIFAIGPAWLGLMLTGLVIGAMWGALFGLLAHAATRGARDFASVKSLRADTYHVLVDGEHADDARRVLAHA